ncbi:MAG: formate dehydrogenase subunit delta [Methylococcales bacterium]|nr:formate dehydrogenase subunit delta [Methylococcales bacterium]MDD5753726.1 formate dehydrogenase subunit delta [Methylococcales bacterium]
MSSNIDTLIKMANDISNFFNADPDKTIAAEGVRNHISRNWELRMRQMIVEHLNNHGGEGLSTLAKSAIAQITV